LLLRTGNNPTLLSVLCTKSSLQTCDFTIWQVGDWGRENNKNQIAVAKQMGEAAACYRPSFVVSTGDNFVSVLLLSVLRKREAVQGYLLFILLDRLQFLSFITNPVLHHYAVRARFVWRRRSPLHEMLHRCIWCWGVAGKVLV
jgi:hypothetical protein